MILLAGISWHLEELCALCDLAADDGEQGSVAAVDVGYWSPLVQLVASPAQAALGGPQTLPERAHWACWAGRSYPRFASCWRHLLPQHLVRCPAACQCLL